MSASPFREERAGLRHAGGPVGRGSVDVQRLRPCRRNQHPNAPAPGAPISQARPLNPHLLSASHTVSNWNAVL